MTVDINRPEGEHSLPAHPRFTIRLKMNKPKDIQLFSFFVSMVGVSATIVFSYFRGVPPVHRIHVKIGKS